VRRRSCHEAEGPFEISLFSIFEKRKEGKPARFREFRLNIDVTSTNMFQANFEQLLASFSHFRSRKR